LLRWRGWGFPPHDGFLVLEGPFSERFFFQCPPLFFPRISHFFFMAVNLPQSFFALREEVPAGCPFLWRHKVFSPFKSVLRWHRRFQIHMFSDSKGPPPLFPIQFVEWDTLRVFALPLFSLFFLSDRKRDFSLFLPRASTPCTKFPPLGCRMKASPQCLFK